MNRHHFLTAIIATTLALSASLAAAGVNPPTGSLVCDLSGRELFRPAVPVTPSTKDVRVKATGLVENCDDAAVTGGKAPINGGTISVTATMLKDTAACANWAAETVTFTKMKAKVKLQHVTTLPDGRTAATTIAVLRPVIETMVTSRINGGAAIELFGYIEQNRSGNAPFGNNRFSAVLTSTSDLAVACVEGTGSVTELTFDNENFAYSAIFLNAR